MSTDESPEGDPILVPERHAVRVGGREVALTRTQFRLVSVLFAEPGRTFSRTELVETGIGDLVSERTVDVHVKEIRRKMHPHGSCVETVRGRGYRFRPAAG